MPYGVLDLLLDIVTALGAVSAVFLMVIGAMTVIRSWRWFLVLAVLACPSLASAQEGVLLPSRSLALPVDAPMVSDGIDRGVSPWACAAVIAGQAFDLLTTELAIAKGVNEANVLMKYRAVRFPFKALMALGLCAGQRHVPTTTANKRALISSAIGFGAGSINLAVSAQWGK